MDPNESLVGRTLGTVRGSRALENAAFALAVLLGTAYVIFVEILPAIGWRLGEADHVHNFPWGLFAILTLLVAPKTVGRATAGKVWDRVASRGRTSNAEE